MKDARGSDGTVILSDDFIMGTYTGQIVFSGLELVIIGNSKALARRWKKWVLRVRIHWMFGVTNFDANRF
jgi:hypothetical protein